MLNYVLIIRAVQALFAFLGILLRCRAISRFPPWNMFTDFSSSLPLCCCHQQIPLEPESTELPSLLRIVPHSIPVWRMKGIWAILALIYLLIAPLKLPQLHHVFVSSKLFILAALTISSRHRSGHCDLLLRRVFHMLTSSLTKIRFIAVAADIDSWCSSLDGTYTVDGVTYQVDDIFYPQTACDCSKASAAFGAFSWYLLHNIPPGEKC